MVAEAGMTPLPQLTGYLLRRAYVRAVDCTRACVSDGSIGDVSIREVAILAILFERGRLSQREVSDISRINRSLVVKLVDALESRGWVTRTRNPADRRAYALHLTHEGAAALELSRTHLARAELALVGSLTDAERTRLRRQLRALLDQADWLGIDLLADQTAFLIAQAHRQVREWALELLRPLGLDPRDFGVLATVGREQPCTQNHLASQLGVTPSAALSFVEELTAVGLLTRDRHPDDRRFYDVRLSAAGSKRLREASIAADAVQTEIRRRVGVAGEEELRALLTRVISWP